MTFDEEMEELGEKIRALGHEVKVPLLRINADQPDKNLKKSLKQAFSDLGGVDNVPLDHPLWAEKSEAIDDHFQKVEWSDAILVANYPKHGIGGYVGGNTLMEIALAWYLRKKIFVLLPISQDLSYKEEILGMRPIIVNDNVNLIS